MAGGYGGWFPWFPECCPEEHAPVAIVVGQPARWLPMCAQYKTAVFEQCVMFGESFGFETNPEEIKQGRAAANNWFLSSVASLLEYPNSIHALFLDKDVVRSDDNRVRIFDRTKGKWRIMLIDDRIPFGPKDKHPLCSCIPPNENTKINGQGWLPLLEKTLASVMDGYQCLSGGFPHCALEALTGDPVHAFCFADDKERWQRVEYRDFNLTTMNRQAVPDSKIIQSVDDDGMWNTMIESFNKGYLVAVCSEGIVGSNPNQGQQEDRNLFAVVEFHEVAGIRIVCIRNPLAKFRWKGDWSEYSPLWEQRQDVTRAINPVLETDSEFYMSFNDMRHSFWQLLICARGSTATSSLKFLAQAAFISPSELARQQAQALRNKRQYLKTQHGVHSCLPKSRNLVGLVGATTGALIGAVGQSTKKVYSSCFRAGGKNFQDLAFGAGAFGAVGGSGAGATEGAQAAAAAAAGGQGESLGTVEGLPGWTLGRTWRSYSDYYYKQYQERYGIAPPGAAADGSVVGAPANTVVGAPASRWGNYLSRPSTYGSYIWGYNNKNQQQQQQQQQQQAEGAGAGAGVGAFPPQPPPWQTCAQQSAQQSAVSGRAGGDVRDLVSAASASMARQTPGESPKSATAAAAAAASSVGASAAAAQAAQELAESSAAAVRAAAAASSSAPQRAPASAARVVAPEAVNAVTAVKETGTTKNKLSVLGQEMGGAAASRPAAPAAAAQPLSAPPSRPPTPSVAGDATDRSRGGTSALEMAKMMVQNRRNGLPPPAGAPPPGSGGANPLLPRAPGAQAVPMITTEMLIARLTRAQEEARAAFQDCRDEPPAGADGVVSVSVEGGGIGGPKVERRFLRTDPLTAVYGLVRMKLAEKHLARAATPGVSVSSEAAVRQIELASPGGFVLKLVSSGQVAEDSSVTLGRVAPDETKQRYLAMPA